jgi:hypothetical protein
VTDLKSGTSGLDTYGRELYDNDGVIDDNVVMQNQENNLSFDIGQVGIFAYFL